MIQITVNLQKSVTSELPTTSKNIQLSADALKQLKGKYINNEIFAWLLNKKYLNFFI